VTAPDPLAEARAALHLDVACPRCKAAVSIPCRTASGNYAGKVHAERHALSSASVPDEIPGWRQEVLF
jgi:phage FluMu protein Com